MKIIELRAENFKRLKAVRIAPDGNVVQITGPNGAGKSSVLDAVWAALGGKDASPDKPIREGQKTASVTLDLGDIRVERKWTPKNSYLEVTSANGVPVAGPQAMLDSIVGRLTFDPLEFARMRPVEQAATLRAVIGLDTSDLERAEKEAFDARTDANRELKRLEAKAAGHAGAAKPAAQVPVDVADLMKQLSVANETRRENSIKRAAAGDRRLAADRAKVAANEAARKFKEAEALAEAAEREAGGLVDPDTTALSERIGSAQQVNESIRLHNEYKAIQAELKQAQKRADELTAAVDAARDSRQAWIASAKMPVGGLGFDETGITMNGIPFSQCSSAEQLRVSVALGMANNPKLRTMTIRDGSLLDAASLAELGRIASENDYQVLLERVAGDKPVGIVIEDGEVVA